MPKWPSLPGLPKRTQAYMDLQGLYSKSGQALSCFLLLCIVLLSFLIISQRQKWSVKRFGAFPNQQTSLNRMQADPSAPKLDDGAGLITAGCLLMLPPGPVMLLAASAASFPSFGPLGASCEDSFPRRGVYGGGNAGVLLDTSHKPLHGLDFCVSGCHLCKLWCRAAGTDCFSSTGSRRQDPKLESCCLSQANAAPAPRSWHGPVTEQRL